MGLEKGGLLDGIAAKVEGYINDLKLRNELGDFHCDQKFLKAQWPVLQTSVMVHDEFLRTVAQPLLPKAFPTRRYKGQFVGQSYNEHEQALIDIEGNVALRTKCTN